MSMKQTPVLMHRTGRWLAWLLVFIMFLPLTACSATDSPVASDLPANFGSYGSDMALELADRFPLRSPGSSQESKAAAWIADAFSELGYDPQTVTFSFKDTAGQQQQSANVVVIVKGTGFKLTDVNGQTSTVSRQVVVGAHYDVAVSAADVAAAKTTNSTTKSSKNSISGVPEPTLADFDGIHDNASGIGTLLLIARQLKSELPRYDVVLVAFGAAEAGLAGANAYVKSLDTAALAKTDAMYNIEAIYAGDKVYAHAGQNSVLPNDQKIYEKRRKLYEVTDIFYEYTLNTLNKFNLNTNQSSIEVPWPDDKSTALYREWTLQESDHTPFDKLGIPIVYFESFDYDRTKLSSMKESANPAFTSTKGAIRHTRFDSTAFLQALLNQKNIMAAVTTTTTTAPARTTKASKTTPAATATASPTPAATPTVSPAANVDQLTRRINNIAFLIVKAAQKE